jgi:6-pyruvoyltetrahydropterin/6-carboxytetrahydropterin synthase
MTYRLRVAEHFDAAHYIRDYLGKCSRMHGHRWRVEITLEGAQLDSRNILVDFAVVKGMLRVYLDDGFDHSVLNSSLGEPNVTAEWLARKIYDDLRQRIDKNQQAWLFSVTIYESPECCVEYYGDE